MPTSANATTPSFEAILFSSANLFNALRNEHCDADEVAAQSRASYLYRYLADMGAKSIIVEHDYTDGDYLEDFASYYVRCHQRYDRLCKRLHFFSCEIDGDHVRRLLLNEASHEELTRVKESYIGFVVARPLPNAIVGRTLLKTYPSDNGRRQYRIVDNHSVNLFGVSLSVTSLPYQEQDSVLAACATVALWCALHRTARLFGTSAPRPAIITRAANELGYLGRSVPSHGLRIEQMCQAVREAGLEPEFVHCEDNDIPLISLVYAHLRMGVPVILIVRVGDDGLHAITLAGYSLKGDRVHAREVSAEATPGIPMVGLRIDELYGHDDQIGPFARLRVEPSDAGFPVVLRGSWKDPSSGADITLSPIGVLIPVYNKIRVTFVAIEQRLTSLHGVLKSFVTDPDAAMEWDVRLSMVNDFKEEIRISSLPAEDRERILLSPLPRFIWRATLSLNGLEVLEVVFDATDMARSFPYKLVIWRHSAFEGLAKTFLNTPAYQQKLAQFLTLRLLNFLKASIR